MSTNSAHFRVSPASVCYGWTQVGRHWTDDCYRVARAALAGLSRLIGRAGLGCSSMRETVGNLLVNVEAGMKAVSAWLTAQWVGETLHAKGWRCRTVRGDLGPMQAQRRLPGVRSCPIFVFQGSGCLQWRCGRRGGVGRRGTWPRNKQLVKSLRQCGDSFLATEKPEVSKALLCRYGYSCT
jgi:hypothetical protein